jgi:hypothetical protein
VAVAAGLAPAAAAQLVTETTLGGTIVAARQSFEGAEVGLGRRSGQGELAFTAAAGSAAGAAALRVSGSADFVLWPATRARTPYAGLGLSLAATRGTAGAGYLTGVVGVEATPAGRRGWYVEAGLGGGAWVAAGIRWRSFAARP